MNTTKTNWGKYAETLRKLDDCADEMEKLQEKEEQEGVKIDEIAQKIADAVSETEKMHTEGHTKNCLVHELTGLDLGEIGTPTKLKDINGTPLFVGDVVEVRITWGIKKTYVVCERGKAFVMGLERSCAIDGTIRGYRVKKIKSYEDLRDGETYIFTKAIIEKE